MAKKTYLNVYIFQELRNKEEELTRVQQQQKREQENLMKLAQELKNREIDLLGRELKIIMNNAPTPLKRRNKIGTSKLKVKKSGKNIIFFKPNILAFEESTLPDIISIRF